mgnify:CR=1 FL=1
MGDIQSILQTLNKHMEFKKLSDLKEYEVNKDIRTITKSQYERLKKDLNTKGQIKNLLVTSDNIVIGGNHRVKAMKDLGWTDARVETIGFEQEPDGWVAIIHGEPQRMEFYKTKEAAMFAYSIKDNDNEYAVYNKEQLMIYADTYEMPYEEIHVAIDTLPSFAQVVNSSVNADKIDLNVAVTEDGNKEKKIKEIDVICPFCEKSFKKEL